MSIILRLSFNKICFISACVCARVCVQILGLNSKILGADQSQSLKKHCAWVKGIDSKCLCKEKQHVKKHQVKVLSLLTKQERIQLFRRQNSVQGQGQSLRSQNLEE